MQNDRKNGGSKNIGLVSLQGEHSDGVPQEHWLSFQCADGF